MSKTIVVVDDEPGIVDTIADVLRDEGYDVATATDGITGLAVIRALPTPPSLIILDVVMPGLDGVAVYTALRADPALASVRVLFVTSDVSRVPPGLPILEKPFTVAELLAAIRSG